MKRLLFVCVYLFASTASLAGGRSDDPLLTMIKIDQLEVREADGSDPIVFEAQGWVGKDLHKLWAKAEVERVSSETEEAEFQLLYGRAIAPYWDVQVGIRHDSRPKPDRNWLAFGVQGLAPYFFEVDAAAFIGEEGHTALRLEAEYEVMLTQKLVLVPEMEINFYGKEDQELERGSGLSDLELGVRLSYEIRREFAPYIGVNWTRLFGETADHARDEGEKTSDIQIVAGFRAWF